MPFEIEMTLISEILRSLNVLKICFRCVLPPSIITKLGNFFLKGCDLYTSCEPCPMCLSAIYWSHVDNIFYANTRMDAADIDFDDSLIYSEIRKDIDKRKIKMKQMNRDEALEAFKIWQNKEDKIKY